ncbi:MAG: phosphopentomutase [Clostridia bacterium]|nr:phosphopentomutase [Clostridia bacterium]
MKARKAALIVIDALGVGAQHDSAAYGDEGANTFLHVYEKAKPNLPNLTDLGLLDIIGKADPNGEDPLGCFGKLQEQGAGKDTTTGHWELAGLTLKEPFPTFPDGFPQELIDLFCQETGFDGVLGNVAASGTEIIERLGNEHLRTGRPIVYTSADSVFQIAAHEAIIPPTELWHICRIARRILTGKYAVGRVIARPFIGSPGSFERTGNRKDFSINPPSRTLLDVVHDAGLDCVGIGKIEDIFNHRGLTFSDHAAGNTACLDAIVNQLKKPRFHGLLMANLVDTDSKYGHRRDVEGYAKALEEIDARLPEIMRLLGDDGLLMITGDHGCDPTWKGTDHTREYTPILVYSLLVDECVDLGVRDSFADVSATILEALGLRNSLDGTSFWQDIAL